MITLSISSLLLILLQSNNDYGPSFWWSVFITFVIGAFAIFQSYHYYTRSKDESKRITDSIGKIESIVTRLEAVNTFITKDIMGMLQKVIASSSKKYDKSTVELMVNNLKGDLTKGFEEKLDGQVKGLEDKLGNHHKLLEAIKNIMDEKFDNFNNKVDNIIPRDKIIEVLNKNGGQATYEKLLQEIDNTIPVDKLSNELLEMKSACIIEYDDIDIYHTTLIKISNKQEVVQA